jgi:hypothetical protein
MNQDKRLERIVKSIEKAIIGLKKLDTYKHKAFQVNCLKDIVKQLQQSELNRRDGI